MKVYIINRMYAGSYINDKLGGEFINLLHDDNNKNYIFINPSGFIDKKYDNKVEAIILTRIVKAGCFEILGIAKIAKNGQIIFQKGHTLKEKTNNAIDKLNQFVIDNNIRYGGVCFKDIYYGKFEGAAITFESEKLLFPKEELYLTDSKNKNFIFDDTTIFNLEDKRFPKQSLHCYITDEDNPKSFQTIQKIINNDSLWNVDKINNINNYQFVDSHFNFLDVIKKDFDELVYSNLMVYIFKEYPNIFIKFVHDVLGISVLHPHTIKREQNNIDILIEDKNNIIVIENKIKSGINGVSYRHNFSKKGLIQSQLLKYYNYVEKIKGNKKASYFIFVPNYNKLDLKQYYGSKNYKIIRYNKIYDFFARNKVKDFYYREFVNALYKHTKDKEKDYAEEMAVRFLNQIKKNK